MKKLMIAAAIVCAAAMSQAATTKWSWGTGSSAVFKDGYVKSYTPAGTPAALPNATVYLLAIEGNNFNTQDSFYQALNGGTKTIADIKSAALSSYNTDSAGKINTAVEFSRTDAVVDGETKYYYALFAASDDGKYVYFSAAAGALAQEQPAVSPVSMASATSGYFRTFDTVKSAGWYAVSDVPEPTSGLLLLLGVAGLALKRRRA